MGTILDLPQNFDSISIFKAWKKFSTYPNVALSGLVCAVCATINSVQENHLQGCLH